jgi:hypothetical protein
MLPNGDWYTKSGDECSQFNAPQAPDTNDLEAWREYREAYWEWHDKCRTWEPGEPDLPDLPLCTTETWEEPDGRRCIRVECRSGGELVSSDVRCESAPPPTRHSDPSQERSIVGFQTVDAGLLVSMVRSCGFYFDLIPGDSVRVTDLWRAIETRTPLPADHLVDFPEDFWVRLRERGAPSVNNEPQRSSGTEGVGTGKDDLAGISTSPSMPWLLLLAIALIAIGSIMILVDYDPPLVWQPLTDPAVAVDPFLLGILGLVAAAALLIVVFGPAGGWARPLGIAAAVGGVALAVAALLGGQDMLPVVLIATGSVMAALRMGR